MTRNLIDIPKHPDLPNVTRKALVVQSINNYKSNCVDIHLEIYHYIDGVEIKYLPSKVKLMGDNGDFVNPETGEKVEKETVVITPATETEPEVTEEKYPEGSMGEYDYLWYLVNVAKVFTQVELEEIYVLKKMDVINKKLYS